MHRVGYRRRTEWREPIIIPRWALVLAYLGFLALGVASAIVGVPSLQEATWRSYTLYWATGLAVFALFGALGALRAVWEAIEKWAAVGISAILSAYTFANLVMLLEPARHGFTAARFAFVVILLILNLLPMARALSLLRRTGLHR